MRARAKATERRRFMQAYGFDIAAERPVATTCRDSGSEWEWERVGEDDATEPESEEKGGRHLRGAFSPAAGCATPPREIEVAATPLSPDVGRITGGKAAARERACVSPPPPAKRRQLRRRA